MTVVKLHGPVFGDTFIKIPYVIMYDKTFAVALWMKFSTQVIESDGSQNLVQHPSGVFPLCTDVFALDILLYPAHFLQQPGIDRIHSYNGDWAILFSLF